ncbi:MAG: fructosamine-3-kinase [Verrucomicrobiales bacterium]
MHTVWELIERDLGFRIEIRGVHGGCINHCAVLTGSVGQLFVKTNSWKNFETFVVEERALAQMAKVGAIQAPEVCELGCIGDYSLLALEYIPMRPTRNGGCPVLGEQLARMHLAPPEEARFGWWGRNFIGATPQINRWCDDWATFFAEQRIGFQLEFAADSGSAFAHGDRLVARIPDWLEGHEPEPSLLHGDLWSGNAGFAEDGQPAIYDPACYYGERETDIAFTEMFGGFEPAFYSGYRSVFPLDDGYERRRDLYNLYHVLNHYNLFSDSYREQGERMIRQLLVGF